MPTTQTPLPENLRRKLPHGVEMTGPSNTDLAVDELFDIVSYPRNKNSSLSIIGFALLKYASALLVLAIIQGIAKRRTSP